MRLSKRNYSLSHRLAKINQSSVLLALVIVLMLSILAIASTGLMKILNDSHGKAKLYAEIITPHHAAHDNSALKEVFQVLLKEDNVLAVSSYDVQGTMLANAYKKHPLLPLQITSDIPNIGYHWNYLTLVEPVMYDQIPHGSFILTIDLKPLYVQVGTVTIITIFSAMFGLLYARRFSKKLSHQTVLPINELCELMERISSDNKFYLRANPSEVTEIQRLADGFNSMLEELEEREQRLNEHREHLEDMVKERTSEMTIAKEESEQARQEAERANKAKSEFLSSMSHELRTPMNAILGFAQLLEYSHTTDDQKDNIDEILKAGRHLLTLINEVLDLAKIESGKVELSMEPVELAPLIADCVSLVEPQAEKNRVTLDANALFDMYVLADLTRLKQSVINLLSNAIKYNHENGKVKIYVELQPNQSYRIYVQDTGVGISKTKIKHLFEPFNRLGAEAGLIEGTGIGLTITRNMIESMSGTIGVTSTEGKGSCFWIELPSIVPTDNQAAPTMLTNPIENLSSISVEKNQKTILYIEDNPANLKLVERIIATQSHLKLLTAPEPELGINLALSANPSLILLDINLPSISGYDVLSFLRKQPRLKDTPMIALTSNAMNKDIEQGLQAGFNDYLTKPVNVNVLLERINFWLTDQN